MSRLIPVYDEYFFGCVSTYPSYYVRRQTEVPDVLCGLFVIVCCTILLPVAFLSAIFWTMLCYICGKAIKWVEAGEDEKLFWKIFTLFQMLFRTK